MKKIITKLKLYTETPEQEKLKPEVNENENTSKWSFISEFQQFRIYSMRLK